MRLFRVCAAGVLAFGAVFALAPGASAVAVECVDLSSYDSELLSDLGLTDVDCVPVGVGESDDDAMAAFILTPGEIREGYVTTGPGVVRPLIATTAATLEPAFGKVAAPVTAAGTAFAGAWMAGASLAVGGVLNWLWSPDDDLASVPPPVPGTAPGSFEDFTVAWPTVYTSTVQVVSGSYGATGDALTVWMSRPATTTFTKSYDFFYWCAGTPGTKLSLGGHSTASSAAIAPGALVHTKAASFCSGAGGWGGFEFRPNNPVGTTVPVTVVPDTLPTDPFPGRTIEQTVSCKRPNGTTYTYSNSSDASAALSGASTVAVAGLMCDVGDRATDATATLVAPGVADTPLIDAGPSFTPLRDPASTGVGTLPGCAATVLGCVVVRPTSEPGPPTYVEPVPSIEVPPGTDTEAGTEFCGFTFSDVLTGAVIFKAFGCALAWAFVPASGTLPAAQLSLSGAWSGTGVVTWSDAFTGVGTSAQAAAEGAVSESCLGPQFMLPLGGEEYLFNPLDACVPPMSTAAPIVKVLIAVGVILAGIRAVMRPVLTAFDLGGAV